MSLPAVAGIGLVGHARSGKTTLAKALSSDIPGSAVVSFGDVLRARAEAAGQDARDRAVLTDLGQRWVNSEPEVFCRAVLERADPGHTLLIIDGIRHQRVAEILRQLLRPRRLILAHLVLPESALMARLADAGLTPEEAVNLLKDPTEADIDQQLRTIADVELNATKLPAENAAELLALLRASPYKLS